MSTTGIARFMYFSRAIDMRSEKDRTLALPGGSRPQTSMLMDERRAATFSAACSRRVLSGIC